MLGVTVPASMKLGEPVQVAGTLPGGEHGQPLADER